MTRWGIVPTMAAAATIATLTACATPYGEGDSDPSVPSVPSTSPEKAKDTTTTTPSSPEQPKPKVCDGLTFKSSTMTSSDQEEWGARWNATRTLLFVTRKVGTGGSIFVSDKFGGVATPLSTLLSSGQVEYPTLSADGNSLYVGAQVLFNWQILVAKRQADGKFGEATPLLPVNVLEQDIHPYVVGDALYWAQGPESARRINRYDLKTGKISEDVLILINKISNPVVTPDELTMYFTFSNKGADTPPSVHMATRTDAKVPFSGYQRVESIPPNSGVTWVSADRCELLYETRENERRVVRSATSP